MLINYVTLDRLPNLLVLPVSFLENEEDNAFSAVYLLGILAEQMSSGSAYEVLKGKMLVECEVCFRLTGNVSSLLLCSPSWPVEGPLLSWTRLSIGSPFPLTSAGLPPVSACWRVCGAGWDTWVGHLGGR